MTASDTDLDTVTLSQVISGLGLDVVHAEKLAVAPDDSRGQGPWAHTAWVPHGRPFSWSLSSQ